MKDKLTAYIKGLDEQLNKYYAEREAVAIRIDALLVEIDALRRFERACENDARERVAGRASDMNGVSSVLVDERDAEKINLFMEALEKLGDDVSSSNVRKNMSKIHYCVYKKRLWPSEAAFREDYRAWVDCRGHWANLPRRGETMGPAEMRLAK